MSSTLAEQLQDIEQQYPSFIEDATKLLEEAKGEEQKIIAIEKLCGTIAKESSRIRRLDMIDKLASISESKKQMLKSTVDDFIDEEKRRIKEEGTAALNLPEGVNENEAIEFGIYEYKGRYWAIGNRGKYEVCNFTMRVLYHVKTSADIAFRLVEIKNIYGKVAVMNLNTDDFVSLGAFKKILARNGNFVFKGAESDLSKLQEKIQRDETPTKLVQHLGWNKKGNFYAFANGIVPVATDSENPKFQFIPTDDYGIIENEEENFFIPANSKIFEDKDQLFTNDKKFLYVNNDTVDFNKWATIMQKVYGEKAMVGILFYVGALFRDIIFRDIGRRFPILNCYGQRGAGKGTYIESIMYLFGKPQDQIMLGGASTTVGFMRKFAQLSNAIVWLDEYKNNLVIKIIESIKNIYDGIGYERGKKDNTFETESTPINSACILSGQEMPTIEPALFTRVIMLAFKPGKGFTEEDRANFLELKEMQQQYLSHITANIVLHRKKIEADYKANFDKLFPQIIKRVNNQEIDERMILNIASLAAVYETTSSFLKFPFTYKEAEAFLIKNMREQFVVLAGSDDIAKFWQVVENLFTQHIIREEVDFTLADGYLYIRIQQIYPHYQKELRSRNDSHVLDKSTLENYLKMDATIYNGYERKRFSDGSNSWVHKFVYKYLNIDLIKTISLEDQDKKYREMGIPIEEEKTNDTKAQLQNEKLPF